MRRDYDYVIPPPKKTNMFPDYHGEPLPLPLNRMRPRAEPIPDAKHRSACGLGAASQNHQSTTQSQESSLTIEFFQVLALSMASFVASSQGNDVPHSVQKNNVLQIKTVKSIFKMCEDMMDRNGGRGSLGDVPSQDPDEFWSGHSGAEATHGTERDQFLASVAGEVNEDGLNPSQLGGQTGR